MMDDELDLDERKLYEELYNLMGAKIRFKCDGYIQEGEIFTIKPKSRRVTLNNVYFVLPDKRIFSGTLKYRFNDLINYEVIATAKELNPYPRFEYLENLIKNKDVGKKYSLNDLFFDGCLSEESDEEEGEVKDIEETEYKLEVPAHLERKVPHDCVVIDCFDLEWKQAINHIEKQKVIGVSFHGDKVSRLGTLSWVCISTSWCVFLIDIEKLGIDAFNGGLRSILEDMAIKKVIHDCRFPSDCLAHQFDTKLVNVFDTLVADFVVSMQCYNDKYKYVYVQSLNSCLRIHLEILPEFTYVHDTCLKKNSLCDFSKRPINNAFRYVLIKNTIYLLLLHETLAEKLLGPLHRNVDHYLRVISGASKQVLETLGEEISSPDSIPPSLLMNGIQTVHFKRFERKKTISLQCKFQDPVTGKLINVKKYLPVNNIGSGDSSCDNSKEVILSQKQSDKENRNTVVKGMQNELPVVKNDERDVNELCQLEKKTVIVDKMIVMPSTRHIDEVYHKLVNSHHFNSHNAESVFNIKPVENYVSKFTMRMPLECIALRNCASDKSVAIQEADPPGTSEKSSVISTGTAVNLSDYSDTWAKLRAAHADSCRVSSSSKSKIKYVPC